MLGLTPIASTPLNTPTGVREFILPCANGDFVLEGQDTGVNVGRFTLTGPDTELVLVRSTNTGFYTLNGQDIEMRLTASLETGNFTLNGQEVDFIVGEFFEKGDFTINGQDVGLIFSTPLDGALFNVTHQPFKATKQFFMQLGHGTFVETPQAADDLIFDGKLFAQRGLFNVFGPEIGMGIPNLMFSAPGSFTLTEQASDPLLINRKTEGRLGGFTLTGPDLNVRRDYVFKLDSGNFALNGQDLEADRQAVMSMGAGNFVINQQIFEGTRDLNLIGEEATFELIGFKPTNLRLEQVGLTLTGFDIEMRRGKARRSEFNGTFNRLINLYPGQPDILPNFSVKIGNTGPGLQTVLENFQGDPVNLLNSRVTFHMREIRSKAVVVSKPATVISEPDGSVVYNWQVGDTATEGLYQAEFEVLYPDGTTETFPSDKYIDIEIRGDVA